MSTIRFTAVEEQILCLLSKPGSYIRPHRKGNGKPCFRLLDVNHNPITNITTNKVEALIQKGAVIKSGIRYILCPALFRIANRPGKNV